MHSFGASTKNISKQTDNSAFRVSENRILKKSTSVVDLCMGKEFHQATKKNRTSISRKINEDKQFLVFCWFTDIVKRISPTVTPLNETNISSSKTSAFLHIAPIVREQAKKYQKPTKISNSEDYVIIHDHVHSNNIDQRDRNFGSNNNLGLASVTDEAGATRRNETRWEMQSSKLCKPDHFAYTSYADICTYGGPPANPLRLPQPIINEGKKVSKLNYFDPNNLEKGIHTARNVLVKLVNSFSSNSSSASTSSSSTVSSSRQRKRKTMCNKAYCKINGTDTISTSIGWIETAKVYEKVELPRGVNFSNQTNQKNTCSLFTDCCNDNNDNLNVENTFFFETDEIVAVKVYPLSKINFKNKGKVRGGENAFYEIAAMQILGQNKGHPNVLGCHEVLCDDKNIYMIMPFCSGGELLQHMQTTTTNNGMSGLDENEARFWFRQILNGLHHLQSHGICHRDLSLENVMLCPEDNTCKIIDFGYCIKAPYIKRVHTIGENMESYEGKQAGDHVVLRNRRLITPRKPVGRPNCMPPEIFRKQRFDGYGADLWACGIILYELLTGQFAYDIPSPEDPIFLMLVTDIEDLINRCEVSLSQDAIHLLKGIFQYDPKQRFTLAEMINHPWVQKDHDINTEVQ